MNHLAMRASRRLVRATTHSYIRTRQLSSGVPVPVPTLLKAMEARALQSSGNAVFVDASYHMNARSGQAEYLQEHIPGARHFDLDTGMFCAQDSPLPHMMPSEAQWTAAMDTFGIGRDDHIIVYTHKDAMSAPRVWYLFKAFGHPRVSILDGGIEAWKRANYAVVTNADSAPVFEAIQGGYTGTALNAKMVATKADVQQAMETGIAQILDARSLARFKGEVPEPREGLVSGSIPGSLNLPYSSLCVAGDPTTFASKETIRDTLRDSGVIFGSKCVSTCGSGVTACYALVGMVCIYSPLEDMPIYDGSWSEWGARDNSLPKVTKEDW
eukprot:GSChrysophyteH2.ASY1.ANO1.1556.1 assembled CDS